MSPTPQLPSQIDCKDSLRSSPYEKLGKNEFRLVEVKGATSKQEKVLCRLKVVSHNAPPFYHALSYSWGPLGERGKGSIYFEIDQQQISWHVSITLEAALRNIRPNVDQSLLLWIDALSINQDDQQERGEQVQQMRLIYQRASQVSVWLGAQDKTSSLAWSLLKDLQCHQGKISDIVQPAQKAEFNALGSFFRRDYFWRIWVVQEIACAKYAVVHCGSESMPWARLLEVVDALENARDLLRDSIFHDDPTSLFNLINGGPRKLQLNRQIKAAFSDTQAPPLLDLLISHVSKGSTDPRDKVYGLVGISADRAEFGKIDYESSPRAIFVRTARHLISKTQKLDVICVRQNEDNPFLLPSWVPDWERRNLHPKHRVVGLRRRVPRFSASLTESAKVTFAEAGEVLIANGFIVDTITHLSDLFYLDGPESEVFPTLKMFHNWWNFFVDHIGPEQPGVFQRTFCGGAWAPRYSEFEAGSSSRLRLFRSLLHKLLPKLAPIGCPIPTLDRDDETLTATEFEKREYAMVSSASLRMHAKRFATSITKLAMLVPMDTKENDMIVILLGCDFPVIMRDMGSYWTLIGEAYVDGIMEGQAMGELKNGTYSDQNFTIR